MKSLYIRKFFRPAILVLGASVFCATMVSPLFADEGDPPRRVARLSFISGNVSFQASGEEQWNQATLNYPLTTGDRIYTDQYARAELETGNIAVRLSANTDLTTTNLNDQMLQLGLSQGTLRVRAFDVREGNSVEVDTPNAALTLFGAGSYRVETYPNDNTTLVAVSSGALEISGSGFSQTLRAGEAVRLSGEEEVQLDYVSAPGTDDFDRWSRDRDRRFLSSQSREYVGDYVPGYSDLDEYGSWEPAPDYGQVWFPRTVVVGWVPYRYGHWAWVEPWGWTWVEDEPWGFAPFHYGRWVLIGARWGWIPGPVVIRPVYAPALVAFVGGGGFSVGVGVQCWFPLGPRDPFFPWYHHSDVYLRQVNITNVNVRNVTYINNYINVRNADAVRYAYQRVAPTAVSTEAFRTAQPVGRQMLRLNMNDVVRARVIPHPQVTPDVRAIAAGAPAAHPPVERFRPVITNRMPLNRGADDRGAQGPQGREGKLPFDHAYNARPTPAPNPAEELRGRPAVDRNPVGNPPPAGQNPTGGEDRTFRGPGDRRTVQLPPPTPAGQNPAGGEDRTFRGPGDRRTMQLPPPTQNQPGRDDRTFHGPGDQRTVTNPSGPGGTESGPFAGPPRVYNRPLVTNTAPPPQNPAFSQRQPALQEHPGRPLEPQQVNNLRQGQPPGAMRDREYAPHTQQPPPPPPRSDSHSSERDQKKDHDQRKYR